MQDRTSAIQATPTRSEYRLDCGSGFPLPRVEAPARADAISANGPITKTETRTQFPNKSAISHCRPAASVIIRGQAAGTALGIASSKSPRPPRHTSARPADSILVSQPSAPARAAKKQMPGR